MNKIPKGRCEGRWICYEDKYIFKEVEYAGIIEFKQKNGKMKSVDFTILKGNSNSVYTPPKEYINFHTHPVSIYKSENTIWGWPSGDDSREIMKFAMNGNIAHLVFTVEGIYVMQVNPGIAKILVELDHPKADYIRGIVFGMIDAYFKVTHGFRLKSTIKNYSKKYKKNIITPVDYMNYINNFSLDKIITRKRSSENIGSQGGFPFWDDEYQQLSLSELMDSYGHNFIFKTIDEEGNDGIDFNPSVKEIKEAIKYIIEETDIQNNYFRYKPCVNNPCKECHEQETTWPLHKIFNVCLFYNDEYSDSKNKLKFGTPDTACKIRDSIKKCNNTNNPSLWYPCIKNNCKL